MYYYSELAFKRIVYICHNRDQTWFSMHEYLLSPEGGIAWNIFSLEKFGENISKTSFFPVPLMERKGTLPANILKRRF